jgi:sugar O-acyltransferase (sialic acid O-acetyltransferase NeuD family)
MAKIIIFGTQDFAQLAHFYLTRDGQHEIAAFTVNQQYITDSSFMDLPIVPFESLETSHPPKHFQIFAPLSPSKMNTVRQGVYEQIKVKGYQFISYISPQATYYDTPIGENCFIFENNVIQPFTTIGNNVIMWSGNHLGHHSSIADHCFIASHAVISGHVTIEQNCFIGVNATLNNGITIAKNSFIGAGALVAASTHEFGVYPGTPAELSRVPSNKLRGV